MLKVMYQARYRNYRGILYLFPSKSDVLDFSRGRISPLIDDNPDTIGKWVQNTDAVGIKRIWNSFLYLRGMISRVGLKSIPVDLIIYDELDEAPQKNVDMAQERMGHSEFKEVLKLSNPTIPDYGIDKAFQETDQRYWLLKCPACGHHTCLEDTFPECLKEVKGRVIRACERCQSELDPSVGEWVAKRPSITEKRGYHYSQLFSHYVAPGDILHQYRTTNNLQDFFNLKIGVAYVEAENRLSVEEVLALCGNEGIVSSDTGPCTMGVDQGKDLHVVIGKKHWDKAGQVPHLGIYKDWEDLDRLMKAFNVSRCVVDALPETRNARAFAERHRGKVFLNYYQEHQKGRYAWNERDMTVSCNRTESLDASHNEIMQGQIILPKECEITRQFAQHLHNVAKKLEEDEETGSKRYIYVKLGVDHFRHGFNYEAMARQFGAGSLFSECDLT
ncbi:MAG: phage terminase large subunit family protein [Desulfobacterales bacterium]|nr:phage terminase large subunit family protein [Desulfobacterales bacterium]